MSKKIINFKLRTKYRTFVNVCVRNKSVWSSGRVVKSPFKDIEIPRLTIDEYMWMNLDKWATKTAMVCGVSNRAYTYEQIYKQSRTLAANLRKRFKIKDGDTVAIMLPNVPEYPILIHGILAAGGIASTFNPMYTSYETQRLLLLSEASVIITIGDIIPIVKDALVQSKKSIPIIMLDVDQTLQEGTVSYKELVEDVHADLSVLKEVKRSHDDVALLPFSSGTTGLPKAVQLTNINIVANCHQQNTECRQYAYTTEAHQDNLLAILPFFHSYGLSITMLHKLSVGLKLVTLPKLIPETFLSSLLQNRIHLLYLAPPMVMFLGTHPLVTAKHLEHLTCVTSGAAPLPPSDIQKFLEKAKRDIQFAQGYGMTEASPLVTVTPMGQKSYEDVGYAIPNIDLRIVDGDMKNLGPGEVGELLVKGPNVMKGYLKNSEANSEVFVEGDWLRSGDIGKIDETGLLHISDRLKELIKVKGYQVPPAELEGVLKEHPSVMDAAVVGVPDPYTGERPKAFVVFKDPGTTSESITNFVNKKVAPYKNIKDVVFLDSIPKNPSGKILRKVIREKYC